MGGGPGEHGCEEEEGHMLGCHSFGNLSSDEWDLHFVGIEERAALLKLTYCICWGPLNTG